MTKNVKTIGSTNSAGLQDALDHVGEGEEYDALHLKPGVYDIDDSVSSTPYGVLQANPGTIIEGELAANGRDPTVILKLMDDAPTSIFGLQRGIIGFKSGISTGIDISKISFNGNKENQIVKSGAGYHNFIGGSRCKISNVNVHDCYVHDSHGDGIRVGNGGSNIDIDNFNVDRCGHDAIYLEKITGGRIRDCKIILRANSAVRIRSSSDIEVSNVEAYTVSGVSANSPGFEIHSNNGDSTLLQDIRIHDCYIHGTHGPGLQLVNNTSNVSEDIDIYNCLFKDCGQQQASATNVNAVGGIIAEGIKKLRIFRNAFDGCQGYSVGITHYDLKSLTTDNTVIVENNIFMNTMKSYKSLPSDGTAIANMRPDTHTVIASRNCFYGNTNNYKNVIGNRDITADPLFVDSINGDYHLKSIAGHWTKDGFILDEITSPCLFKAYELGRYDGTDQASIYPTAPGTEDDGPENHAFIMFRCSESQLADLEKKYPEMTILRRS